jgi:aminoglycoside 6'-N-acetyltransferase I
MYGKSASVVVMSGKLEDSVLSASFSSFAGVSLHKTLFDFTSHRTNSRRLIGAPGLNVPEGGSITPSCARVTISFWPFTPVISVNVPADAACPDGDVCGVTLAVGAVTSAEALGAGDVSVEPAGEGVPALDASFAFEQPLPLKSTAKNSAPNNRSSCLIQPSFFFFVLSPSAPVAGEPGSLAEPNVMSIVIRPVTAADVGAWAAMRAALWLDADPAELRREADAFATGEKLATPHVVFIAEDESPIGFLELSVRSYANGCDSMPVPFIEGWYVKPGARRRGVGRALILAAEDWSRERGFVEIGSDTEVANEDSIEAHERCDFAETERVVYFRKGT